MSLYNTEQSELRFRIERDGTGYGEVGFNKRGFFVVQTPGDLSGPVFGLFQYRKIIGELAEGVMRKWLGDSEKPLPPWVLKPWAVQKAKAAVSRRFHPWWLEALERVPEEYVLAQKKFFAYTFDWHPAFLYPDMIDKMVLSDITNYRAASAALWLRRSMIYNTSEESVRLLSNRLKCWRGMFSPDGIEYRSLNRTLTNLPGNISAGRLSALSSVRLSRPIFDRQVLLMLLGFAHHRGEYWTDEQEILSAIYITEKADRRQVQRAIEIVRGDIQIPGTLRRQGVFFRVAQYIVDAKVLRKSNTLVSAAKNAVAWHRQERERRLEQEIKRAQRHAKKQSALPPIPLPEINGIRFLANGAEILEEGRTMEHCVGSMVNMAHGGQCYLFHVSRNGSEATVCVEQNGRVNQAYGPRNVVNAASEWGARELRKWAKGFVHTGNAALSYIPF